MTNDTLLALLWDRYKDTTFSQNAIGRDLSLNREDEQATIHQLHTLKDQPPQNGLKIKSVASGIFKVIRSAQNEGDSLKGLPLTDQNETVTGQNETFFLLTDRENESISVGCLLMPLRRGIPIFKKGADKKSFNESKLTRWEYQPDATALGIINHLDAGRIIVPGKFEKCSKTQRYRHTKDTWQATQMICTDADQIKGVEFTEKFKKDADGNVIWEDVNPNGVEAFTDLNTLFELCPQLQGEAYAIGHSLNSLSTQKPPPHIRCRIHFLTEEVITSETDYKWLMLGLSAEYPIVSAKRHPAQPVYGNAGNRRIIRDGEIHELTTPFETKIYGNVLSTQRIRELVERGKQAELDEHARREAERQTKQGQRETNANSEYTGENVRLADWLKDYDIPERGGRDGRYIFVDCPWENEHTSDFGAKDTAVWEVEGSGEFAFHCFHTHCEHRGWNDYRQAVAPREQYEKPTTTHRYLLSNRTGYLGSKKGYLGPKKGRYLS